MGFLNKSMQNGFYIDEKLPRLDSPKKNINKLNSTIW
jgi:hypothetical protein